MIKLNKSNNIKVTLRTNQKNFTDEKLPHKLFLTTRRTTKIRDAFTNNMSTDIKLSKAQISKIILSVGSFGLG